jgi:PKD repeat protein
VDDAALRTSITKPVTVAAGVNHPPVAVIYALQLTQESGKPIAFDGSASYDEDGTVVNYTWDFGDGSRAYYALVNHIFTLAQAVGKDFTVSLTVTDDLGQTSSASVTVTITPAVPPNLKPNAALTATFTTPLQTNTAVHLSASGSTDPDGTIPPDGYSWSFGDGEIGSGMDIYHSYAKAGIYVILLTVKDNRGATGSATETVYVNNQLPKPKAPADFETSTLDPVQLSGAGSSDNDGQITGYSWDLGDGTQDRNAMITHTYYYSGVYTVRLTVVDDNGAAASATLNITVRNRLPVAALEGANASGYVGDPLSFDGSSSSDADGRIVNYSWDFGDGYLGAGPIIKHSFNISGTFNVRLTVTDDKGGISYANMTVTIIKRPVIKPPTPAPAKGFIPGFEVLLVASVLVLAALAVSRKRK